MARRAMAGFYRATLPAWQDFDQPGFAVFSDPGTSIAAAFAASDTESAYSGSDALRSSETGLLIRPRINDCFTVVRD